MYKSNQKNEETYSALMSNIKKINSDWIDLRNSTDYKIGMALCRLKRDFKNRNFKSMNQSIKSWIKGRKNDRTKSIITAQSKEQKESNYFSEEKIAIYTCIYGGYDDVCDPICVPDNCDFFIFTDDDKEIKSKVWKKHKAPKVIENMNNIEKNRYIKMHPHELFPEYKYSIYIDGNVQIISDLTEYVNILNDIGIGIHMHHLRKCIFEELKGLQKSGKISKEDAEKHYGYLQKDGMPKNYGLLQCNVIVREHNKEICIKIMEEWWEEFKQYSKRDQVSLPHVLYKNNIKIEKVGILGNNVYINPSFRVLLHK